jgi:regulator of protease activity HflC (stomatin/prohibitin superfamily)
MLEISFQYRVLPDKIYAIYTQYGDEMKNILLRMAIDSISDTATGFSSYDFFTMRTNISRKMQDDLDMRLRQDVHCQVVFF